MKKSQKGFTLVEIMVAVAILAIASVAVLRYFSQNLYSLGRSSSSVRYAFDLKFYFAESLRRYSLPITSDDYEDTDVYKFEDDNFEYTFAFEKAPFVDQYDVKLMGVDAVKINIAVKSKDTGKKVYEGEAYHLFRKKR